MVREQGPKVIPIPYSVILGPGDTPRPPNSGYVRRPPSYDAEDPVCSKMNAAAGDRSNSGNVRVTISWTVESAFLNTLKELATVLRRRIVLV